MMKMRLAVTCIVVLLMATASVTWGQAEGGRRGGFRGGGFGGGMSRLALLRSDAVQKELALSESTVESVQKLQEELRAGRRGGGQGGGRGNFQDLSQEERDQLRQRMEERAKQEQEKLTSILSTEQMARLNQIYIQQQGARALRDPDIAEKLGLSEQQQQEIATASREAQSGLREQMQDLFQSGGDRQEMFAKMAELRTKADEGVLAVLTGEQKEKFAEMKGKPFELPPGAFRGRGGGQRGQGRRGGGRGNN